MKYQLLLLIIYLFVFQTPTFTQHQDTLQWKKRGYLSAFEDPLIAVRGCAVKVLGQIKWMGIGAANLYTSDS